MIARNPSLTDQVKAHLKEQIVGGEFADGRIPPEAALAEELGVSRTTVRDALAKLEHEGVIYRRQGAGTFVNHPGLQIKSRLDEIWSYQQVLEDHGYTPAVEVISAGVEAAGDDIAEALDIDPGDEVLLLEKLFLEDDRPAVLVVDRIPLVLLDGSEPTDAEVPIYDFLEEHADRRLAYYVSEIVPLAFDAAQAYRLGVPTGTVGLAFVEVGYDQNNEPVVHATSCFRDDLLRFRVIRRRSGA